MDESLDNHNPPLANYELLISIIVTTERDGPDMEQVLTGIIKKSFSPKLIEWHILGEERSYV